MQPTDPARSRAGLRPARRYLLVCDVERAWVVDLPEQGTLAIGRSSECQIVLADTGVSRVHAEVAVRGDQVVVRDRGSQNGTKLGGAPISERALAAGDVIEIGGATLVFHSTARSAARTVEADVFAREVEREIERTQVSKRGFAVLAVRAAGASPEQLRELVCGNLRPFETAASYGSELLVLCPELDGDVSAIAAQLAAIAAAAGAPEVGYASCPHDGVDAAALIAAARAERVPRERGSARTLRAGDRELIVAEPATIQLYALVERLAKSDLPVLVRGETGVGKEIVAQALHAWSPRGKAPFVAINCAALPEQLAESELFGHERGAFSGAIAAKPGLLESARGGTVLLDEIGDMTLPTQAKLLRALETKRITRLGSVDERDIDIRLVAATHRDLEADVAAGRFRRDLYFRLGGGTLVLPPLRDRPRELVLLAEAFLAAACRALRRDPVALADDALLELVAYAWPGNVRELKLVMEYLAAAEPGRVLSASHVAQRLGAAPAAAPRQPAAPRNLREELEDLERRRILEALDQHDGHQANAAAAIGMPLRTFVAKLKRYRVPGKRVLR
jgi:two-component system response regulator AtoC